MKLLERLLDLLSIGLSALAAVQWFLMDEFEGAIFTLLLALYFKLHVLDAGND